MEHSELRDTDSRWLFERILLCKIVLFVHFIHLPYIF